MCLNLQLLLLLAHMEKPVKISKNLKENHGYPCLRLGGWECFKNPRRFYYKNHLKQGSLYDTNPNNTLLLSGKSLKIYHTLAFFYLISPKWGSHLRKTPQNCILETFQKKSSTRWKSPSPSIQGTQVRHNPTTKAAKDTEIW